MNPRLSQTIVQALGWTLVHFLWQGLVIAALLAAGLRLLASRPAHYKYLAACVAMALMALAPLATFRLVLSQPAPLPAITPISAKISPVKTSEIFTLAQPTRATIPQSPAVGFFERLNHLLPWLVLGWLAGVCALSSRLFLGWLQVRRLRRNATRPLPSPWPEKLAALALRLGVHRSIQPLQSALIEVPTVIGWLRPVILLPASCLTGLTPGQLEAIIAHELAHIRRHDYLVNLLQSTIETLLFYHPAVWWVSRRIREERENCCDDLAVEACGDLVGYARALATLEELRPASAQLMLAAAGAPLLQRIRRLAGQPERSAGRASWPMAGIAVLLVLAILAAERMEHRAAAMPQLPDKTNVNKSPPLEVRTFHVDPKTFIQGLERVVSIPFGGNNSGGGGGIQFLTENDSTAVIATAVRNYFLSAGVNLSTNTGTVIIFNEFKGTLTVRATSEDLEKIEAAVQTLNSAPPETSGGANSLQTPPSAGDNAQAATNQTQVARLIQDGKFLYEVGRYDEAAIKFKQALSIDPASLPASQYLRLVREKLMSHGKPIKLVADAAGTTPSPEAANTPVSPTHNTKPPEVVIKAWFVEMPMKDGETNWSFNAVGTGGSSNAAHAATVTGILTAPQFHATLNALEQRDGTDVLHLPVVTTESGRQAQLRAFEMRRFVTSSGLAFVSMEATTNAAGKVAVGTTNPAFNPGITTWPIGPTLDVLPTVSADGKYINLTIIPSITEFIGYDNPGNAVRGDFAPAGGVPSPAIPTSPPVGSPTAPQTSASVGGGVTSVLPLPHFRLRQVAANVTALDGQTVFIGGLATRGSTNTVVDQVPLLGNLPVVGGLFRSESTQKIAKKQLLVFVTVTLINPDGTLYHSDEERKALLAGPPPQQSSTNR